MESLKDNANIDDVDERVDNHREEENPHPKSGRVESVPNRNMIPTGEAGVYHVEDEDATVLRT